MKATIPPPPVASFERKSTRTTRPKTIAPLDAGFMGRLYVSSLYSGALLMMLVYGSTRSLPITLSFVGGMALGVLLLKSQEIFVQRLLTKAAAQNSNVWTRLPLALLLGAKYVVVFALLGITSELGWLVPAAFALGFVTEQLIIAAKIVGRYLTQRKLQQSLDNGSLDNVG